MKKINLLTFLLFAFGITFAQMERNSKNPVSEIVEINPVEYADLKMQGKLLAHKEYRFGANNKQSFSINSVSSSTSTPCDNISFGGTSLFFGSQDDASAAVSFPFNFCFYGANYTSCNVSTNGNVQFLTNSVAFSGTGFPSNSVNMIAPFWSDVHITSGGSVKVDVYSTSMIISWDSVGYYSSHNDKTNSFQLIITDGTDPILPGGKNVGFIYKKMQWTTGDASSGVNGFPNMASPPAIPATIGINQGNGIDYLLVGRFGAPGNSYDGPNGNNDGVSWLDGKRMYFNVCPPTNSNLEPVSYDLGYCDSIHVCGNDSVRFKTKLFGPEANQTVTVTATCPTLSGALTYSTSQSNGFSDVNVLINGAAATNGYHTVTISALDNGTPALSSSYNVTVFVDHTSINSTSVTISTTPTLGICPGQTFSATASFSGTTPDSYSWSNGDISSFTSYTLNSASDSLLFLTVNSLGCQKTITSSIRVNPIPNASIIGNATFCGSQGSTTVLTASNTVNYAAQAPYTYSWISSNITGSVNTQSVNATQGTYSVIVTNNFGCSNSAQVNVVLNIEPQFTVTPTYTSTTTGGIVNFDVNLGAGTPSACGLATSNCASTNTFAVGSGTTANTSTNWPSVYGNYYKNSRHQMLYTAGELLATGVVPGKISSISYIVNTIPVGYVGTLSNYSVKLKCVVQNTLSSTFDNNSLIEVFNGSITPAVGINTHTFSQAYLWDGTSDLLVDVCYSLTTNWSSNPIMPYTNTGAGLGNVKCVYFNSDASPACGNLTGTTTNNRPNIIFGNCSSAADPNDYTYSWSPPTGLNDPTIKNPVATISGSQVYTVTVTNTNTPGCPAAGTATVDALPTSINTITKLQNSIFIYPNPNNGKFEISLLGYDLSSEKLALQVSNTLGQTVYSSIITDAKTSLNLQEFTNGVYFITISNTRKEKAVNKIVIQN